MSLEMGVHSVFLWIILLEEVRNRSRQALKASLLPIWDLSGNLILGFCFRELLGQPRSGITGYHPGITLAPESWLGSATGSPCSPAAGRKV